MTLATRIHGNEDPTYWLNRNQAETNRLLLQSRLINPITRAILVEAGLASGMTVLDIGSGPGDVALLAAKIVGPTGKVVGVDKDPAILEVARRRACAAGLTNVHFIDGDVRSVEPGASFDAITGRLVLLYLGDPVATLAALTERLRPGGIAAIQEANIRPETVYAHPQLGIWEKVSSWVGAAAGAAGLNQTIGFDLRRIFLSAGLPEPSMRFDSPIGGGMDWAGYDYIAATVRNMLPLILKTRIASADEIDIATLADQLRIATTAADSVVKMPDFVSAWSRKPFVTDSSKEETTCEKPASADEPATSAIATPSSLNGEDEPSAVHVAATWTHSTG